MKNCVKKDVCKHLIVLGDDPDGPCAVVETCKFILEAQDAKKEKPAKRHYKKRHYKKRLGSDEPLREPIEDDSGITKKQIVKARLKITIAEKNDKLTDNQTLALKSLKGIRFPMLTGPQKNQIINIAKDL